MMDAEIYAVRRALKMLDHSDSDARTRAREAETALDAIEKALNEEKPQVTLSKPQGARKAKK
jgi:hypothetical protein